jgi:hypothetical protein
MASFLKQFCGVPQSQELLVHYVWQDEWNVHKSEDEERTLLGKVHVLLMSAFPKCLEKVSDYFHWLSLKNDSVDIGKAKESVLRDPSCFYYCLKKRFCGAKTIPNKSKPGRQISNGWRSAKVRWLCTVFIGLEQMLSMKVAPL